MAGFVGLALIVLLVVLFAVSQMLDNRIREDISANFQEAGNIFEQLQDVRFRQLRQTATLVAEMPYMKAAINTGDPNTVNSQIQQQLSPLLHFDPLISDTLSADPLATSLDSVGLFMVFDRQGMPLGHLPGSELPTHSMINKAGIADALEGQFPTQSHIWKQGNNYFNVITIPVTIQGQVIAALSLGYPIRNREAELLARVIEYEVSYFVDDNLLATSMDTINNTGRKAITDGIQQALFDDINQQGGATIELGMDEEQWLMYILPMVGSSDESGITGYYAVAKSLTQALEPLHQLQKVIYLIGFGGILLAVILGITMTNNLTRPINLLLDGIKRIENDEYDQPVDVVSSDEFGQLTRTFNKLVSDIKENLKEKETLLAEIHHRVKNNLAVISGLLQLEGFKADDEQTERILKNSQLRIHSMATVHELLYEAQNFNKLSFVDFITKMVSSIQDVYESQQPSITISFDTDDVHLNVNQAVPCGLIINELVTNAFKHAYPNSKTGKIDVILHEKGEQILLKVKDEGQGLPDDFTLEESDSLGFKLIQILSKQIDAEVSVDTQNGTAISVSFKKRNKKGASSSLFLN